MEIILSAQYKLSVQFYDLDPMQVVWHGNYPRYFEQARGKLLDLINYNYKEMESSGFIWPIVDFRIKYIRSLKLHQQVVVSAHLIEYEHRLKIKYEIHDFITKDILTRASSVQVAVNKLTDKLEMVTPMVLQERVMERINVT